MLEVMLMETITKIGWGLLGAIHVKPSLVLFLPSMTEKLYNVVPTGDTGVLLTHRAAMFFTVVVISGLAMFDPSARRLGSLVVAISMIGFLIVYTRAGMPAGSLRSIALVDLFGLLPLAFVSVAAWNTGADQ